MINIKSQIDELQTKLKELRTKKREEKLQKLQSQYDKLILKKYNTTEPPSYFTENIPILFNTFFTKTDDQTSTLSLKYIWGIIKNSDEYAKMIKNKNTGRTEVYIYVMELFNIQPNLNSHKPIIVKGISRISI